MGKRGPQAKVKLDMYSEDDFGETIEEDFVPEPEDTTQIEDEDVDLSMCTTPIKQQKRTGKPSIISKVKVDILYALSKGQSRTQAADYAGVHRETLHKWIRKASNPDCDNEELKIFLTEIRKAEAVHAQNLLDLLGSSATHSWQAAAWILERRYKYVKPGDVSTQNVKITNEQQQKEDNFSPNSKEGRKAIIDAVSSLPQEILDAALKARKEKE